MTELGGGAVLIWMIVGIALLSSEAFTGTFHLLFFGLAALVTASVTSLGMGSIWLQLFLFIALSALSAYMMRLRLVREIREAQREAELPREDRAARANLDPIGTADFKKDNRPAP